MPVQIEVLEDMVANGATAEMLLATIRVQLATRSPVANRVARHRAKKALQSVTCNNEGVTCNNEGVKALQSVTSNGKVALQGVTCNEKALQSVTCNTSPSPPPPLVSSSFSPTPPHITSSLPSTPSSSLRSESMQSKFEEFWAAYPKRDGANPRKPAYAKFIGHWKSGADPDRIIAGAREYHSQLAAKGQVGSPYVAQATTWLNQQRWEDHLAPKQSTRAEQLAEEAKQILAERLRRKANAQTAATAGTNGHHVDHPGELLVEGRAVYPDGDLFPRSGTDDPSWH